MEFPSTNLCAVLHGKNDLRLLKREEKDLKPQKGEVLLAIRSVGICGSDVHLWSHGCFGDWKKLTAPTVLGHESSAVVVSVGEGVTNLKLGDRVAIEPGIPCYHCTYCKGGRYNLCPYVEFGSTPPIDGFLRNYKTHPADLCFKLPDHISLDEGALLEPVSVAVHACRRAQVELGSKVLICGAGPIGLVCLIVAKACGTSYIVAIDIDAGRLETAKVCGASQVIQVDRSKSGKEVAQKIKDTIGFQLDKTIECSGAQSAISTAIYATRAGGVVVLVGLGEPKVSLPIVDASVREVDIRGVFRYSNCFPVALDLISTGKIDVNPLITHHYKLNDVTTAFHTAKTGHDGAIKVIVDCNDN